MDPNSFLLLVLQRYELLDAFKNIMPTKDQVIKPMVLFVTDESCTKFIIISAVMQKHHFA